VLPDNPADLFYIIIDSDDLDESIICAERYHDIEDLEGFDCGDCDLLESDDPDYDLKNDYCHSDYPKCDLNCDGKVDLEILKESSFGWMDLDGGGSNANELRQWVLDPSSGDLVFTHHWYASKSGIAGSVYDAVGDNLVGKNAIVPVFDSFCHGLPEWDNDECMWHPRDEDLGPDDVVESGGTWDDYFHIIGFANYKVMCVESGPHPLTGVCEIHDELVALGAIKKNAKSIEGCFIKGVSSNIVDAGGGDDFDAYTLVLSR
jgi:hypothetical protein